MDQEIFEFPLWLRVNHFINLFCIFVLMRSGVQILADHPKLYWNEMPRPGANGLNLQESDAERPSLDLSWRRKEDAEARSIPPPVVGGACGTSF